MQPRMSNPSIEEILAPKPEARPRIYAYSIDDKSHAGLLKVGQIADDGHSAPVHEVAHGREPVAVANVEHDLVPVVARTCSPRSSTARGA